MTYSFQDRLDRLRTRMPEVNTETVTYRRGDLSVSIAASPVLTKAEEMMPGVAITRIEHQQFVINAADLVLGGATVLPDVGDTITRTTGEVFRVSSLGSDTPPYEFTTSKRNRFIVHTDRLKS